VIDLGGDFCWTPRRSECGLKRAMTKRQPAATHPKAAPAQLLSIAIATLASKPNDARIVKESPRFIWRALPEVSVLCRRMVIWVHGGLFSRACAARDHEGTRPTVLTARLWNLCLAAPLWNLCGSLPLTWRSDAIGGTIVKVSRHEIDFKMASARSAPSHQCRI
jgi:hypothetical protein